MQMPRDVEQKKKTKEYQSVLGREESLGLYTRVRQWFSKGPIDRHVHSFSFRFLSRPPINHCITVSLAFALFLVHPAANVSSLFVKAASRHALGDWGMRRDCALQFGQCLTVRANRLCN